MSETPHARDEPSGIIFAASAYAFWGIVPIYWRFLGEVPPFELTVHRVLWCTVFLGAVIAIAGHTSRVLAVLRTKRLVAILALTSLLISCNWTIYIYCVATDQLVDASLGYYMTPLVSFAAGIAFFGERMSRLRMVGAGLAGMAIVVQMIGLGHVPWIAPALALSFGFYGYFRKLAPVAAMDGLFVETLLLFPLTLGLVGFWTIKGNSAFPSRDLIRDVLLIAGGPVTAVPLALFAAGARRIRLTTLGFLQYLSPSITLVLAIFGFHERFSFLDAIAFGCVWTALVIVAFEGRIRRPKLEPASG